MIRFESSHLIGYWRALNTIMSINTKTRADAFTVSLKTEERGDVTWATEVCFIKSQSI